MPNWCDNVERIVGPKEQVKALCDNLNKWIHTDISPERSSDKWLGNIVYHSGLAADKNPGNWGYACRGELVDGFYYEENGNEGIIQFSTMTAWGPYPKTWYALLKKCAPDAKYYYTAFEPDIFSARRIKLAPVVCLFGFVSMIYAVVRKPKEK